VDARRRPDLQEVDPVTTILLIRHGLTDAVGRRLTGWTPGIALNADGRAQVRLLAARLGERIAPARLAALYSSPLERAQETANAIAAVHGLPVEVWEDLGEFRFGDWSGRSFEDLDRDPAWRRFNVFRSGTRAPGGETMVEVQARIARCLLRLRDAHPEGTVAAVSHGDAIRAAVFHLLGIPLDMVHRLEIGPASVTTLRLDEDGVRVLGVNDTCPAC
jgi:probable phosphoglycerate mutase